MTNKQHTYWISIGRNVDDDRHELGEAQWGGFIGDVEALIIHTDGAYIISEVSGGGAWDGIIEDTHLFLVSVPAIEVNLLRARLALLLPIYHQDAIGFVGGPSTDTLIRP